MGSKLWDQLTAAFIILATIYISYLIRLPHAEAQRYIERQRFCREFASQVVSSDEYDNCMFSYKERMK